MIPPCAIWAAVGVLIRLMGTDLSAWIESLASFPDFSSSVTMASVPIETLSPGFRSMRKVDKIGSWL